MPSNPDPPDHVSVPYLPPNIPPPLRTGFMFFWAAVFLLTTTAVALFKHESPLNRDGTRDPELDVRETYSQLVRITSLRPVRTLIVILLTVKVRGLRCW